ncbi:hypothetical protein [Sediminibacterium sp.]|uniref:hypothetical protein n=1 Tax=Sediminibacterium sp. TaxID=1917865 RepID=UPI0027365794|nr:hypothetical protein [Sediminibacterium sp.]MDP3394086.1 hypothetical protein [Sediminibacterium sp.]MDP3566325.1 hypothetical protein [Sediminibacterium sp.]
MTATTDNNLLTTEDFRLFMARIVFGMLFLVMAIQMGLNQMPYQLPLQKSSWYINSWFRPTVSIIASTAVLVGFFIPTRGWSILSTLLMLLFNLSYLALANNAYYNFIWWAILIPFCINPILVFKTINRNKWLVILFAAANWFNYGLNLSAIPVYLLYFLPFLPFKALFDSFNRYYEPR